MATSTRKNLWVKKDLGKFLKGISKKALPDMPLHKKMPMIPKLKDHLPAKMPTNLLKKNYV